MDNKLKIKNPLNMKKYNVYIVDLDFKAVEIIGKDLNRLLAKIRVSKAENKISNSFFVDMYEVGTSRDLELKKDLEEMYSKKEKEIKKIKKLIDLSKAIEKKRLKK